MTVDEGHNLHVFLNFLPIGSSPRKLKARDLPKFCFMFDFPGGNVVS